VKMMSTSTRIVAVFGALAVSVGLVTVSAGAGAASAAAPDAEGILCDYGQLAGSNRTFSMSTGDGHIAMPDGNVLYSWGYTTDSSAFRLPGPSLCAESGDLITVTLTNNLDEATSIVFPGQVGVTADGAPSVPIGANGRVSSLAPTAAAKGGTVTYQFTADRPGTFLYESGTDPDKQVEMGLYGALIVRPKGHATWAYGASSEFQTGREFLHVLSQVDPALHLAVETKKTFDWSKYSPKYFLLNGRSAPDTVAPNNASWLPSQPQGSMVHVQEQAPNGDTKPALVRYINVMPIDAAFHPHGNTERVIAEDGAPLNDGARDGTYGSFLVDLGANRTADALFDWTNNEKWDPVSNPLPIQMSPYQDVLTSASTWYSMSPYLGQTGELPAGVTSLNVCGEYYHMAHNHALQRATNYGASFGGQMTLIRIDPANDPKCLAQ